MTSGDYQLERDDVCFGRTNFMQLCSVFCIFFGIILLEIVYGMMKLIGML